MPLRITANFALSADGKVSTRGRHASGFGSTADHARLLELRAEADAILVGLATLEADTMSLGLGGREDLIERRRMAGKTDYPARVIACGHRWPSSTHPLFHSTGGPIHLLSGPDPGPPPVYPQARIHSPAPASLIGYLDALAAGEGWHHLHCEGGPRLFRTLLESGRIDSLFLTITPRVFGGHSAPALLPGDTRWTQSRPWKLADMQSRGDEIFLRYEAVQE